MLTGRSATVDDIFPPDKKPTDLPMVTFRNPHTKINGNYYYWLIDLTRKTITIAKSRCTRTQNRHPPSG